MTVVKKDRKKYYFENSRLQHYNKNRRKDKKML